MVLRPHPRQRSIEGCVRLRRLILATVVCLSCMGATQAQAQSEDQIKAAFLFNFARYVEWPTTAFAGPDTAVRICMAGSTAFANVVAQTVSGKSVENRPVRVDTLAELSGASDCHILYLGEGIGSAAADVASSLSGVSVFTVADRAGFAKQGGMANFIRADNKVRFEINPSAAKMAGLKVSSRLLRLAKVVE
jgi:hypothetical protein